jgi:hypothetical protein
VSDWFVSSIDPAVQSLGISKAFAKARAYEGVALIGLYVILAILTFYE